MRHDDDGALGIIVNNSVDDLPLGQVYKQLGIAVPPADADQRVLFGGPVETSRGLVLHSADYKRDETLLIDGGMASSIAQPPILARTITVYGDVGAILRALGVDSTAEVQARVVTRSGEILAAAAGEPVGAAWDAIARELLS